MSERQNDAEYEEFIKRRRIQNRDAQRRFRHRKRQKEVETACMSPSPQSASLSGLSTGDFSSYQPLQSDDQDFLPMSLDPSSNQPVLFPSQASAVLSPPTDISPPSEDSLSCDSSSLRNSIFTPHSTSTSATRPDRNRAITESQPWIPHGYHHSITGGLVSQSQSSPQLWMPPTQGRVQNTRSNSTQGENDDDHKPLLHIAAENGQERFARALIMQGVDVNEQDGIGNTALSLATRNGHKGVVRLLLENNAAVDIADGYGWTPFHHAAESGSLQCLSLLLHYRTRLDTKTEDIRSESRSLAHKGDSNRGKLRIERRFGIESELEYRGRS